MIPAYSMVPPGIEGYEPAIADYAEMSQIDREDEAKKILTELGYGPDKPLKMEIRYNTSENHKNTAVAIQEQLKPLGIEVTLLNTDTKTHYGHLEQQGRFRRGPRRLDRRLQGPGNLPRHLAQGLSGNNYANYNNPKFEDLMNKAAAAGGNPAERIEAPVARPRRCWCDDLRNMPLLYYSFHNIVSPEAQGLRGQCDGRPSDALHQQGIDWAEALGRAPAWTAARLPVAERSDAALCDPAVSHRHPDALPDRHDLVFPDARRARRAVQSGARPQSRSSRPISSGIYRSR